jgi:hypothetical protein
MQFHRRDAKYIIFVAGGPFLRTKPDPEETIAEATTHRKHVLDAGGIIGKRSIVCAFRLVAMIFSWSKRIARALHQRHAVVVTRVKKLIFYRGSCRGKIVHDPKEA